MLNGGLLVGGAESWVGIDSALFLLKALQALFPALPLLIQRLQTTGGLITDQLLAQGLDLRGTAAGRLQGAGLAAQFAVQLRQDAGLQLFR